MKKIKQVDTDWEPRCYEIPGFGKSHFCFYAAYPLPAIDTLTVWIARYVNIFLWLPVANIFGSVIGKVQEKERLLIKIGLDIWNKMASG